MKKIKMFYQEKCPFCRKAFKYMDELKQEHPEYKDIEIETVEETLHPDIANEYDYYYVPTFYMDGKKYHEGGIFKNEVEDMLKKALE